MTNISYKVKTVKTKKKKALQKSNVSRRKIFSPSGKHSQTHVYKKDGVFYRFSSGKQLHSELCKKCKRPYGEHHGDKCPIMAGKKVETKLGRWQTKNGDKPVNGKITVYLDDGKKILCDPKNIKPIWILGLTIKL